jgi:hypothetical protein
MSLHMQPSEDFRQPPFTHSGRPVGAQSELRAALGRIGERP